MKAHTLLQAAEDAITRSAKRITPNSFEPPAFLGLSSDRAFRRGAVLPVCLDR